jgi:hypothetical protein
VNEDACEVAILDFRAVIEGPADLVADLRAARHSWGLGPVRAQARFHIRAERCRPGWYRVEVGDGPAGPRLRAREVVAQVDRAINAAAVDHLRQCYTLVHAGAVAFRGGVCLLPAPSGSGKTTLVAGLAAAGLKYFSDEVAVLDPTHGLVLPFAKPLGVKAGARRVLARAYPRLQGGLSPQRIDGRSVWLLPPPAASVPAGPLPVRAIVLPRYVPRGRTVLQPIAASEAFAAAWPQLGGSPEHAARDFSTLTAAIRAARCYRLTVGRLSAATRILTAMLARGGG